MLEVREPLTGMALFFIVPSTRERKEREKEADENSGEDKCGVE
jgi:hypothetical protein